jgi:hypothetical protein
LSSKKHNLLQFTIVLESGKRRKPWIRGALVSKLYPYFFDDILIGNSTSSDGNLFVFPILSDQVVGQSLFGGGELRTVVIPYDNWPAESVIGSSTFGGGALTQVVIRYDHWPAEQVNGTATFGGGRFPSIFYGNYAAEQVNGTATFGGGQLTG